MPQADDQIVESCLREQDRLVQQLQDERATTPERPSYHYSGDTALYQIVQSGQLWLSDYTTLNDPSELRYGVEIGLSTLQQHVITRGNTPIEEDFATGFQSVFDQGFDRILRAYVLSMSVSPDELTQWRSYADGATGYCLGFDTPLLDRTLADLAATVPNVLTGSFEMIYDEARLRMTMAGYVTTALNAVSQLGTPTPQHLQQLAARLYFAMIYSALYFKHPAYASEQEYRLMLITPTGNPPAASLKRARRHKLVEYLTLDWRTSSPQALRSIKIGPAGSSNASAFIADTLSLHLAGQAVVVDRSSIPFRV